ncbi:hypothetical protein LZ31DRAFT_544962 [Colletotrichum somersetense]|nr:hypothetical protein LZ31DRAFT_544962 [Colletotrichum somersetense]
MDHGLWICILLAAYICIRYVPNATSLAFIHALGDQALTSPTRTRTRNITKWGAIKVFGQAVALRSISANCFASNLSHGRDSQRGFPILRTKREKWFNPATATLDTQA